MNRMRSSTKTLACTLLALSLYVTASVAQTTDPLIHLVERFTLAWQTFDIPTLAALTDEQYVESRPSAKWIHARRCWDFTHLSTK
jgi:hypothetical protein